jgi:hypothetical protein
LGVIPAHVPAPIAQSPMGDSCDSRSLWRSKPTAATSRVSMQVSFVSILDAHIITWRYRWLYQNPGSATRKGAKTQRDGQGLSGHSAFCTLHSPFQSPPTPEYKKRSTIASQRDV